MDELGKMDCLENVWSKSHRTVFKKPVLFHCLCGIHLVLMDEKYGLWNPYEKYGLSYASSDVQKSK